MKQRVAAILCLTLVLCACVREEQELNTCESAPVKDLKVNGSVRPGIVNIKFTEAPGSAEKAAEMLESYLDVKEVIPIFPDDPRFTERHHEAGLDRWYSVAYDRDIPVTKASGDLSSLPFVEIAEGAPVPVKKSVSFNDPYLSKQWHYDNPGGSKAFLKGSDMNLRAAWNYETGSDKIIVAVIDEGIRYTHEDLRDNMWINEAEYVGRDGVDDDNNGYVDDIYGYNFCYVNSNKMHGTIVMEDHGTHVAGTIAAVNNNAKGGCGIAGGDGLNGGVRIMCCQALQEKSATESYPSNDMAAFVYAADNGACICNNSWGYTGQSSATRDAIRYFNNNAGFDSQKVQTGPMAGGVAFFSAGNENTDEAYPAMFDECFSVAAIGPNMIRANYSNYGDWVDICAPGGNQNFGAEAGVLSCTAGSDTEYSFFQGTSMACPHVTGAAALALSSFGRTGFTRLDLINLLKDSANPDVYNYNKAYAGELGAGRLDAGAMYGLIYPSAVTECTAEVIGNTLKIKWIVPRLGLAGALRGFKINFNGQTEDFRSTAGRGTEQSRTYSNLEYDTEYSVYFITYDEYGNESDPSQVFRFKTGRNNPPELLSAGATRLILNRNQSGTLLFRYSDVENDAVSFSFSPVCKGLYANKKSDKDLEVTVEASEVFKEKGAGNFIFDLVASDEYGSSKAGFTVNILNHISPEIIKPVPDAAMTLGGTPLELSLRDYFDCDENPKIDISCSLSGVVRYSRSGENVKITPVGTGITVVTIKLTDEFGDSKSQKFKVTVYPDGSSSMVYPTQVKGTTFTVCVPSEQSQRVVIKVVSSVGTMIVNMSYLISNSKPAVVKLPGNLAPGVYTVVIAFEDGTTSKQTIVKI